MAQPSELISLDTALEQMLSQIVPISATDIVPLTAAFGRILAENILSPLDVPGFDNAAMDGYALREEDFSASTPVPVAGKAFAGQPFTGEWPAGTCIRIMTGAPVPEGCDAVIMQEDVTASDDGIMINRAIKLHQNIRRRGEDIARNAVVFFSRATPYGCGNSGDCLTGHW